MSVHGLCDRDEIHDAHEFDWEGTFWQCPGQWSQCRNCDDRKCMGCVFRVYDHDCKSDCPDCCGSAFTGSPA
jgi:hypothetical protein